MEHPKTVVRTATLRGIRWKFKDASKIPEEAHKELGPLRGLCDYEAGTLYVPMEPSSERDLDTIIHEVLHAVYPDLREGVVEAGATEIARVLHRFGYRSPQDRLRGSSGHSNG